MKAFIPLFFAFPLLAMQSPEMGFSGCDLILDNRFYHTCYSYQHKGAIASYSKLDGKLVNRLNIKDRSEFVEDIRIPKEYRTSSEDFKRSGFDRGHNFSAPDASFDYDVEAKNSTYLMSNITLQYPNTNRKSQMWLENYQRDVAVSLGEVEVFTHIHFSDKKHKGISIPLEYHFMLRNKERDFQKCFILPNNNKVYNRMEIEVDCNITSFKADK